MSVSNLEQNKAVKDALKSILTEVVEEDETSFNFGGQLTFSETDILYFHKMFAMLLAKYFSRLDFGKNAIKTYVNADNKPAWWPKIPKWKEFRSPSKATKDECTLLVVLLPEHYIKDPSIYYMNYPDD